MDLQCRRLSAAAVWASALALCAVFTLSGPAWSQEKPPKDTKDSKEGKDAKDAKDPKTAAADVILVGGQERKVGIKDETFKGIEFEGGSESIDKFRVLRYSDTPAAYSSAEGLLARRDFAGAAAAFARVADDCKTGPARKIFLQHALYRLGKSHQGAQKYDDALTAYRQLLSEKPDTCYWRDVFPRMIDCCVSAGKPAQAIPQEAEKGAKELGDEGDGWLMYFRGLAQEADKKWNDAGIEYAKAKTRAAGKFPRLNGLAIVGGARAAVPRGSLPEAEGAVKGLLESADIESFLRGAAWNVMGDVAMVRAEKDKATQGDSYRAAAMAYARSLALCPPGADEPTSEHERAYFQAGQVYEKMAASAAKEERSALLKMARKEYQDLQQTYPQSRWTTAAGAQLRALPE